MFKKLLSMALCAIMVMGMGTTAFASEPSAPTATSTATENVVVLNDPVLMERAEKTHQNSNAVAPRWGLSLKNKTLVGQRYYSDSPFLVDSIQGAMSVGPKIEFETKETAGFNGECGVGKGDISASFGVDFSYEETVRRTYQFDPIPAGKTLTYKAFVNYNLYEFDVYSGSTYLGKSSYWYPVGIVVLHSY